MILNIHNLRFVLKFNSTQSSRCLLVEGPQKEFKNATLHSNQVSSHDSLYLDFAFVLAEYHHIPLGPSLHPVRVLLSGSPALAYIDWYLPQFDTICKLYEQALHYFLQVIDKDIK